ncbi:MAG: aldo/keto reductase [Acetatifactor sp.]
MQYRGDRYGQKISLLGYGCMRFTRKGTAIDIDKAEQEVMEAIKGGVNYFDTAYIYPGSEVALGEILARNHCREQVYIADKLPQYLMKSKEGIEKCFQEQCKRLQTDYIDYYLMHMLTDAGSWEKLVRLGIQDWVEEKKKSGQIRNIGFSFHGNTGIFLEILEAYDWDFCQIQYNYLDEHSQAGRKGLEAAQAKGIPVIIMEPLRGGKLVDLLPETAKRAIAEYPVKRTPAEWAFRWLYDQPGVTCVLSGMNSMEMVQENLRVADSSFPNQFTEEDFALINRVKEEIAKVTKVGCTGCGYCMPCPKGVDIPATFRCYNEIYTEGKRSARKEYLQVTALRKIPGSASNCIQCGKCEMHCPQHIRIREELRNASGELETFFYRFSRFFVKLLKLW